MFIFVHYVRRMKCCWKWRLCEAQTEQNSCCCSVVDQWDATLHNREREKVRLCLSSSAVSISVPRMLVTLLSVLWFTDSTGYYSTRGDKGKWTNGGRGGGFRLSYLVPAIYPFQWPSTPIKSLSFCRLRNCKQNLTCSRRPIYTANLRNIMDWIYKLYQTNNNSKKVLALLPAEILTILLWIRGVFEEWAGSPKKVLCNLWEE